MGGVPVQAKVIQYVEQHPGLALVPTQIASDIGETPQRVLSALSHMLKREQFPGLTRLARGLYMYRPLSAEQLAAREAHVENGKPTGPVLYELVGRTDSIGEIVRDETGMLYKIERL